MAAKNLAELCASYCAIAGLPARDLQADSAGMLAFTITRNDVDITLAQNIHSMRGSALVFVDYGAVPPGREEDTWPRMLDTNYMLLGDAAVCFSRNPSNGHAILQFRLDLAQTSPEDLVSLAEGLAEGALYWREFLAVEDGFIAHFERGHEPRPDFA